MASAICASPAAPGTSDGLTESIATRSWSSEMHGSVMGDGADPRLYHARMDVSGRVAAITGASSGIGLAIARQLAREGTAVVLGARRAERLDDAVREIRGGGGRADAVVMDVTIEQDVN